MTATASNRGESTGTNVTGWTAWAIFAATMLILAGVFDIIYGLVAVIGPDSAYFIAATGDLFLLDVAGWGWWHLISGASLVVIGVALLSGATWARVVAIILVGLNAVGQLTLLPVQPWWSLIVLTIDILIIYALTVHGRELKAER
ncbi:MULTISPECIES: hypothetical protein [unclassified Microbacterium]|uniref:DUF7144 family membrane protein n=1 Tax=unclassified Microbacterium TaxID=2609290 RepID=UPI00214BBD37|nr:MULTISPECIES: hypothetical protein [unclassified Microbacterium]MCR2785309.1 hypothetical protein [Microbacterium sp. zg.B96]WIM16837.1 hypothetical protein QNO11_04115 [Microbacterium sp. zg-B96]